MIRAPWPQALPLYITWWAGLQETWGGAFDKTVGTGHGGMALT